MEQIINSMRILESFLSVTQYMLMSILYCIAYLVIEYKNPAVIFWLIYVVVPLLDDYIPWKISNPDHEEAKTLGTKLAYKFPLYCAVFADWFMMFYIINYIIVEQPSLYNLFFLFVLESTAGGSNINVAHELLHKDNIIDKWVGTLTLARNMYSHFAIEHVHGHHRNVATPVDPASSHKGEIVYSFWVKSVVGSYLSAWDIESKRVMKTHNTKSGYSIYNQILWFNALYLGIIAIFYAWHGLIGAILFVVLALSSSLMLETINYVEHYGLRRKEIAKGLYEPVDIHHSWNAPQFVSNLFLFKLQRHSDHHENPYKPYQTLCSYDSSPTLPHGYPVCILLSLFPQTWFDIMDDHLKQWQQTKKNIEPTKETKAKMQSFLNKVSIIGTLTIVLPYVL